MRHTARHRAAVALVKRLQGPHEYDTPLAHRISKPHFLLVTQAQIEHGSLDKKVVLLVPPRHFHRIAASIQEIHKLPPRTQSAYARPNGLAAKGSQIIILAGSQRAGSVELCSFVASLFAFETRAECWMSGLNTGIAQSA